MNPTLRLRKKALQSAYDQAIKRKMVGGGSRAACLKQPLLSAHTKAAIDLVLLFASPRERRQLAVKVDLSCAVVLLVLADTSCTGL